MSSNNNDDAPPSLNALHKEFMSLLADHGCIVETEVPTVRPEDILFACDMQNDLFPGGSFPVKEAEGIVADVRRLMLEVFPPTNKVFVTRDYHPIDHCSFQGQGGPFPPHCVQGSFGSFLHTSIVDAVRERGKGNSLVVFKGFCPDIDSLGATPYSDDSAEGRLAKNIKGMCCSSAWTGAFVLKCSNMENDVNAPPDVMAVLNRKDIMDTIGRKPGQERPDAFVCGLSFDLCVLDTALNAATNGVFRNVYVIANATRAMHMPEYGGSYGTGFLNDPKDMAEKIVATGVRLINF
eukprot:GILI01011706.1.p1 GENE.GILI01011706.1~~GILI01011706.1.p1  ORF type:complete len:303 (-),score=45.51 GILI01011706.1:54-932(-)